MEIKKSHPSSKLGLNEKKKIGSWWKKVNTKNEKKSGVHIHFFTFLVFWTKLDEIRVFN